MSQRQLKESSHLAEQLICLRSDLERQSVEIIRQHRQNSSTSSCCTDVLALFGEERTPRELMPKTLCGRNTRSSLGRYTSQQSDSPLMSLRTEKVTGTPQSARRELEASRQSQNHRPAIDPPNKPYRFPTHSHGASAVSK